jgi:hypothetical protein
MSNWHQTSAATPLHRKFERLLPFNPKEFLGLRLWGFLRGLMRGCCPSLGGSRAVGLLHSGGSAMRLIANWITNQPDRRGTRGGLT